MALATRAEKRHVIGSSVFCRCGAQWHGRTLSYGSNAARARAVVAWHLEHCGPLVSAETFALLGHRVKYPAHWADIERRARNADLRELK